MTKFNVLVEKLNHTRIYDLVKDIASTKESMFNVLADRLGEENVSSIVMEAVLQEDDVKVSPATTVVEKIVEVEKVVVDEQAVKQLEEAKAEIKSLKSTLKTTKASHTKLTNKHDALVTNYAELERKYQEALAQLEEVRSSAQVQAVTPIVEVETKDAVIEVVEQSPIVEEQDEIDWDSMEIEEEEEETKPVKTRITMAPPKKMEVKKVTVAEPTEVKEEVKPKSNPLGKKVSFDMSAEAFVKNMVDPVQSGSFTITFAADKYKMRCPFGKECAAVNKKEHGSELKIMTKPCELAGQENICQRIATNIEDHVGEYAYLRLRNNTIYVHAKGNVDLGTLFFDLSGYDNDARDVLMDVAKRDGRIRLDYIVEETKSESVYSKSAGHCVTKPVAMPETMLTKVKITIIN